MKDVIIAIDGPSGAGKGTIARAVASRLGYQHVDTGAMYRALAWKGLQDAIDLADEPNIAALAARADFDVCDGRVRVDGQDIATAIRTPEMDRAASIVARQPRVREVLILRRQRALGARRRCGHGGAGYRHGRLPAGAREDLPGCLTRGTRPPPRHRSGALGRHRSGGDSRGRGCARRARPSRIGPAPCRR